MKINIEQVKERLKEYARGVGGGLIFGLPILFTQELWHQGFIISAGRLVIFLMLQYLLLLGYVYYAGFREEYTFAGVAFEAVEALGISFLVSATILFIMAQLTADMSLEEILGRIVLTAIPVSIGVATATVLLREEPEEAIRRKERAAPGTFGQYVVALGGAEFFAFTFSSTEEITIIGIEVTWWHVLLIMLLSLITTYSMVFYADFKGTHGPREPQRILETPFGETIAAYALALITSVVILFLVGRLSINDSLNTIMFQSIVLGFPASLGAAAGRLII